MTITLDTRTIAAARADLLVIAGSPQWKSEELGEADRRTAGSLAAEIRRQGFKGALGDVALFQTHSSAAARYVVAVGIGATDGGSVWNKLAHHAVTRARDLRVKSAAIVIPKSRLHADAIEAVTEGLGLSSYSFDQMKGTPRPRPLLQSVRLVVPKNTAALRAALDRGRTIAAATCYARDIINLPAAVVTPTHLANEAKRIARAQRLTVRIRDAAAMRRLGMGAILGVAQGTSQPPRFIELVYRPAGKARRSIALAGKGITFDSGGLSLKNAEAMQAQKRDMAGGAAVLAVMSVVRDLAVPVEVRAYIPATENMPGERAIKPGDVLKAFNGKTIEVLNTDAEGRLVLADALSYAAAAAPDVLIDLATLTAAVRMALGSRYAAIMGTDRSLVEALIAAGRACGENLWELPLVDEYRADINSTVGDIKNTGEGGAGTIIGGLFLREFVGKTPWAHIDFSSTVMADKPFPGHPRGATGFGVRTLLRYLLGGAAAGSTKSA